MNDRFEITCKRSNGWRVLDEKSDGGTARTSARVTEVMRMVLQWAKKFAIDTTLMGTEGWAVIEDAAVLVMKVIEALRRKTLSMRLEYVSKRW